MKAEESLYKLLKNGSTVDMSVDGSSSAAVYSYTIPEGRGAIITRMNITIVDGAMGMGEFAGLGAALTNGLKLEIQASDGTVLLDFTDGINIKTNEQFALLAGVDNEFLPAAGDDHLPVRFTLAKADPDTRGIEVHAGQKVVATVQDNLTAITYMAIMIQGKYVS